MSTEPALDDLDQQPPPSAAPPSASILDDLRAIREAKIEETQPRLVVNVPQYQDRLAIIFRWPETGAEKLLEAVEREVSAKDFETRLNGACAQIVTACAAVVFRDPQGRLVDEKGALLGSDDDPQIPANPLRFDRRLAETLKIEVPEDVKGVGRFVCRNTFSPRGQSHTVYDGDLALISTSNAVFAWLNGARAKADEDAAGE